MTLDEYNATIDEVTMSREIAYAILEEAESKRKDCIRRAREFIAKHLGEDHLGQDVLVSISSALYRIEQMIRP